MALPQNSQNKQRASIALARRVKYPIGTLKEIRQLAFIDPALVHTCSAPVKSDGETKNRGCSMYHKCPLSGGLVFGKDTPVIKDELGPVNLGVRQFKSTVTGFKTVRRVLPCFTAIESSRYCELNDGVFEIMALEGEMFEQEGVLIQDTPVPGQGIVRSQTPIIERNPVPKFPRPTQNRDLLEHVLATRELGRRSDVQRSERLTAIKQAAMVGGVEMRIPEDIGEEFLDTNFGELTGARPAATEVEAAATDETPAKGKKAKPEELRG